VFSKKYETDGMTQVSSEFDDEYSYYYHTNSEDEHDRPMYTLHRPLQAVESEYEESYYTVSSNTSMRQGSSYLETSDDEAHRRYFRPPPRDGDELSSISDRVAVIQAYTVARPSFVEQLWDEFASLIGISEPKVPISPTAASFRAQLQSCADSVATEEESRAGLSSIFDSLLCLFTDTEPCDQHDDGKRRTGKPRKD
jgi:hypothetical protein